MDAFEALLTRRSIGKLGGDVSDAELRQLVEAGLRAPNHKLTNPWRFIALRGAARERLGEAWGAIAATSELPLGIERQSFVSRETSKALRAPLLLVIAVRTELDPVRAAEDFAAGAAAVQNVLLAAHALGLGAIWRTGEMAYRAEIKAHLGLEATDRIVAIVYLGRPTVAPPAAQPREVEAFLTVRE